MKSNLVRQMFRFLHSHSDFSIPPVFRRSSKRKQLSLKATRRYEILKQWMDQAMDQCHFPSEHHLNRKESAAIFLYTMESDGQSFYQIMKKELMSNETSLVEEWLDYLHLLDNALNKLPDQKMNIWGRCDRDTIEYFQKTNRMLFTCPTSWSSSEETIKAIDQRHSIPCCVQATHAKDISRYSSQTGLNEIVLTGSTEVEVMRDPTDQNAVSSIQLREIHRRSARHRYFRFSLHLLVIFIAFVLARTIIETKSSDIHVSKELSIEIQIDSRGNRYEGEWKDGKKHGQGRMVYANGYEYVGEWADDTATGQGIFLWPNGDRYEGMMYQGQRHGQGTYSFVNGDHYQGDWFQDQKQGYGIAKVAAGKYEGQFHHDKMHGFGTFYFTNGDIYVGEWIDDQQDGQGNFTWLNGDRYEGGFKAGQLHGNGSIYLANGNQFTGEWIRGQQVKDHGSFTWLGKDKAESHSSEVDTDDKSKTLAVDEPMLP